MTKPRILSIACVIAAAVALPRGQAVQPGADERFEALATLADRKMREQGVPGVALGIVDGDRTTIRGFGVTSVEYPQPVDAHTVFPIASISKTFAATAALRLAEEGKLDLKDPVRKHLPEFRVADEAVSREVTLWHLLTHTSGWEGQVSGGDRGVDTLKHFVDTTIRDLMQLAPPGAAWSYNNAGFGVLGRVIEVLTGQSANRAMRDLVFRPIGLEHAGTTAGEFMTYPFALGHDSGGGRPALRRPFSPSVSVTVGGVGLCMTDLLNYARFHMGDGRNADGEQVLTRASLERMRTPQLRKQSTDDDMGLGWHLRTIGGLRAASHGGTLGGHILLLEIVPERQFAVALLTNSNTGWRVIQDVERAALASYLGVSFAPNQAIAHRGLVETLPNVTPLAVQPALEEYTGTYRRPMNAVEVRAQDGRLLVQVVPERGDPRAPMPVSFYGPDRVVVTDGEDAGQSIEFVRDADGRVRWIRVVGRIAVRGQRIADSGQRKADSGQRTADMPRPHAFRTRLDLPLARERLFPFFAEAANLERITPPELRFRIITPPPIAMVEGALIRYRLRLLGVPFEWLTRIAVWDPPKEFVDEQVKGPYRKWVHRHLFVETPFGTRIHDSVTYELPFYPLGEVAAPLVQLQVRRIFAFRARALERVFA